MAQLPAAGTAEREGNLRRKVEPPWRKYAIEGSSLSALGIPVLSLFTSSHDANSIFHKSFCHDLTIHSKAQKQMTTDAYP